MLLKTSCRVPVEAKILAEQFSTLLQRRSMAHDDEDEAILSAFLTGEAAVRTWEDVLWVVEDDANFKDPFASLVRYLAFALRRRTRLRGRDECEDLVQGFLSGYFIVDRLRHLLRECMERSVLWDLVALDIVKHCIQLSPGRWAVISSQLEIVGEEDSALRAYGTARVREIRTRYMQGRYDAAECEPDCLCRRPAQDGQRWRMELRMPVWRNHQERTGAGIV
ncbi:hypothetical protein AURDEDRAFT_113384 [Auricularia subglabra TFB-10046 SS5]|nr:hypothetical protein AURDEDRAFT_113384 [Auricularia subglabra TFB-10046 SS5]